MQKPCRHLNFIALGKLSDKLESSSPIPRNYCISCSKPAESPVFSCLTCLQSFCQPSHLAHHARERNHPLSFNIDAKGEGIEEYFYCSICLNKPRISEPGRKERVILEKVKGYFEQNQKNEKLHEAVAVATNDDGSSSSPDSSFKVKPKGITNLGNTCFMNSALQLLAATLKRHGPLKTTSASPIWNSLIHHLEEIYSPSVDSSNKKKKKHDGAAVNPREFLSLLCGKQKKFASMQQQDAHDFIRLLFNSVPEAPQTELFGGKFVSRVVCERCKKVSDTVEPFLDISLALPDETADDSLAESMSKLKINKSPDCSEDSDADGPDNLNNLVTLDLLLQNWSKKISLQGENGYYCESCSPQDTQILQSASLQFILTDPLPPFLILHLQRFRTQITKSTGGGGGRKSRGGAGGGGLCLTIEKDDRSVSFPLNLKVKDSNYRLYGYIIHEGSSTSCGHYTAVVCTAEDSWFYVSDALVKEISKSRALDPEIYPPYLLFYQRL